MRILMIASSFPKYPGEMTAPFIEEIAAAVAARGHEVHMLLPDHPELRRGVSERGIHLHRYTYAPHPSLSVWGYAGALDNDVRMRVFGMGQEGNVTRALQGEKIGTLLTAG